MFKFISEPDLDKLSEDMYPNVIFTMPDESCIPDMLGAFQSFLLASGYSFTGTLVIEEDEKWTEDKGE